MRVTFHIGKYTVTIIVYERKKSNRHSAKRRKLWVKPKIPEN